MEHIYHYQLCQLQSHFSRHQIQPTVNNPSHQFEPGIVYHYIMNHLGYS